jgi:hypothetical protein
MSKNRDLANYGTAALEDAEVSATAGSVVKRDASGNVNAVDVFATGNVGVGTSSPDTALHVRTGHLTVNGSTNDGSTFQTSSGSGISQIQSNDASNVNFRIQQGTNNTGIITFGTRSGNANLERMRIDNSGHAIIPAGVTLGTAAGVYNAANTLDDYEEGTWTPTFNEQPSGTGRYTKIGRLVTLQGVVECNANGSASGPLGISGLPFAVSDISLSLSLYIFNVNSSATGNNIASPETGQNFFIRRDAFVRQNSTGPNPYFNYNLFKIGTVVHIEGSYLTV